MTSLQQGIPDDSTLTREATALFDLLQDKCLTLSTAESCTGGLIASALTGVDNISRVFIGGGVCYCNDLKTKWAGVTDDILKKYGAVSSRTAEQMARGIAKSCSADIGISVTGIAGPGGGSAEKPVGTVYIAVSCKDTSVVQSYRFSGTRNDIRFKSADAALRLAYVFVSECMPSCKNSA